MNAKTKAIHDALYMLLRNCHNQEAFDEAVDQLIDESDASRRFMAGMFIRVAYNITEAVDPASLSANDEDRRRPLPSVA